MDRQEYLWQVTIIEGRHLKSSDDIELCDPFCKIRCGNHPQVQATTCEEQTATPIWNQSFTFAGLMLTDVELQTFELTIEVHDYNNFMSNELVGSYSIGLSTLHKSSCHEFFNVWLTLMNVEKGKEPQGYLKINAFIVGPDDQPPVHQVGEHIDIEDDDDEDILMNPTQLVEKKQREGRIQILETPNVAKKGYLLSLNIYKAEGLELEDDVVNPFTSIRIAGIIDKTDTVSMNQNPSWNANFRIPVFMPILNDKIVLRIWDQKRGGSDRLIASIPELPSYQDEFNISNLLARGGSMPAKWINLYGHPLSEKTAGKGLKTLVGLAKKTYAGSAFLGRVLIQMYISRDEHPEYSIDATAAYRIPDAQMHVLRVNIYDLKNAKNIGSNVWINVQFGPNYSESSYARPNGPKSWQWGTSFTGEKLREIKQYLPTEPDQIPDVFINLYTESVLGGAERIGYIRRSIKNLEGEDNPRWLPMKSIDYHSESSGLSPGLLLWAIGFHLESNAGRSVIKSRPRKVKKFFYVQVFGAYDLAPKLPDDEVSAFFEIQIADKTIKYDKKDAKPKTKHPLWSFQKRIKVELSDNLAFEENFTFSVMNITKTLGFSGQKEIGHFSVPLSKILRESRPYFFHLVNEGEDGVSQGRILAQFKLDDRPDDAPTMVEFQKCNVKLWLLGARGIQPGFKKPKAIVSIAGYEHGKTKNTRSWEPITLEEDASTQDTEGGNNPNFLQYAEFLNLDLPDQPLFLPVVNILLKDTGFLGSPDQFTQIPLIPYANWVDDKIKGEAMSIYNRTFQEKDTIEQIPQSHAFAEANNHDEDGAMEMTDYGSETEEDDHKPLDKTSDKKDMAIEGEKNFGFDKQIVFDKNNDDLQIERIKRKEMIDKIKGERSALDEEKSTMMAKTGYLTEQIESKDKRLRKDFENVLNGEVDEAKFWAKAEASSDEDDFDYGRPVLKGRQYEDTLNLPYKIAPLFKRTTNKQNLSIYRIGDKTGAVLKFALELELVSEEEQKFGPESVYSDRSSGSSGSSSSSSSKSSKVSEDDVTLQIEPKQSFDLNFFDKDLYGPRCPFFDMFRGKKAYKIRVYVLRVLNLSAVDSAADLVATAGGYDAKSSADAYPEIYVGPKRPNDTGAGKYICEQNNREEMTLNPEFFRSYEFEVRLPLEWNLDLLFWDYAPFQFDNFLGKSVIDVEDRLFSTAKSIKLQIADIYDRKYQQLVDSANSDQERKWFEKKLEASSHNRASLVSKLEKQKVPVEYRGLRHPKKKTVQGMIEMWCEVMDTFEARRNAMVQIMKPEPEEYEMRFIVWKVEGLPMGEKDAIDIYIKAELDVGGWQTESEFRETDAHTGSEDGNGIFNYRWKFPFTLPCIFPRLRIIAYDFETFSSDIPLAEMILDLGKHFRKLRKEGRISLPDQEADFTKSGSESKAKAGTLFFSIDLLTKQHADQRPVGEAQEEPNRDPELEAPTEGRGIMDFLKGTAIDPRGLLAWFNFGFLKKAIALFVFLFGLVVLFVYPGLMIN